MIILKWIISFLIGFFAAYLILYPKVKTAKKVDEEIELKNKQLNSDCIKLSKQYTELITQKKDILKNIEEMKKSAEESADSVYKKSLELANERMDNAAEKMRKQYQKASQAAEEEYLKTLKDCSVSFQTQINLKQTELQSVENKLNDLNKKLQAAVKANKRQEEMKNKQDFYRLNLTPIDIEEILKIRGIAPFLRNSEPLNKVIWKVYYEKAYTDLVGRVIGSGVHTGIYKITNIENHMCYVGQSANIAERWRQHIKRGIGADTPTKNKLYPAMLEYGVENFTFEVIEECDRSMLNEREDYWQNHFGAKEYGYSIK